MDITEVSMLHHVAIVLFLLGFLSFFNRCHPLAFFLSFLYLYLVHETIVVRLRRKVQFEERKQANQKRVLSDSETVRWLNHAVEKIWPICMEQIASQKILLPIIPWFLEKYKPWTAKKALVQHLYLGRSPPHFTEMRVRQNTSNDDHLVLELGMNFRTADDMSAILAIKLTRRLGFGMWAKMHMTGMHVEGKVLIGVKFIRGWPFISRLRVCFAEPPYFQMTVKPIFSHGLDVTVLPGIAGWLDKLLSVAFEQSLVQPNMLVVDMEKFVEPEQGNWFSVDEKEQIASVLVEVIEASDIKPSDLNGLADPYVKGQLGPYSFRSKVQRKTLTPKWVEEFRIPICTWDSPNVLAIEVRDKDHFVDDSLGVCTVNVNELRDGERRDMWLSLQNIKMGRLHIAITVNEKQQGDDNPCKNPFENLDKEDIQDTYASNTANRGSFSSNLSEKSHKVADNFEPINIEGQQETGIWIHHPGSEVSPKWEPRKGKSRNLDAEGCRVPSDSSGSTYSAVPGLLRNSSSSSDENTRGKNRMSKFRRGLRRVSAVFHRHHKNEDQSGNDGEDVQSPYANIRALNRKDTGVKFIVDESDFQQPDSGKDLKPVCLSPSGTSAESPNKETKAAARSIFKHAGNPGGSIKKVLSRKGSKSSQDGSSSLERESDVHPEYDSSDESIPSPQTQGVPVVVSNLVSSSCSNEASPRNRENIVPAFSGEPTEGQIKAVNAEGLERIDESKVNSEQRSGAEDTTSSSL